MSCWAGASRIKRIGTSGHQIAQSVPEHSEHQRRPLQQPATGNPTVRQTGEEVEALGLASHRLGQHAPHQPGHRHALAGIAVRKIDPVAQPPDMGHPRPGHCNMAAPDELEVRIGDLGK